jgi:hypothetical protein
MGRLSGWSVTFLHLPGASGENPFTPLFDIVKHTTTEGSPTLFTGSGDLKNLWLLQKYLFFDMYHPNL